MCEFINLSCFDILNIWATLIIYIILWITFFFFEKSIPDPNTFWIAIQTIAIIGGLSAIIIENRRSKREIIRHKFEGFRYAMNIIESYEYLDAIYDFD